MPTPTSRARRTPRCAVVTRDGADDLLAARAGQQGQQDERQAEAEAVGQEHDDLRQRLGQAHRVRDERQREGAGARQGSGPSIRPYT